MQLNHYNTKFHKKTHPITLVCDRVSNAPNIGSLFRIADAFGIEKIIFCGADIPVGGRRMTKTSRATEKVVAFELKEDTLATLQQLKANDYQIISLEITQTSQNIATTTFDHSRPMALVIGDENFGVSENSLSLSDQIIHIEMYGQNSSMNVVQATAIALYEMTK